MEIGRKGSDNMINYQITDNVEIRHLHMTRELAKMLQTSISTFVVYIYIYIYIVYIYIYMYIHLSLSLYIYIYK